MADPKQLEPEALLTDAEREALVAGATWYAKYHESIIASYADDDSTLGVSKREHFEHLHAALWKLGVRLRRPAGLQPLHPDS